MLYEKKIDCGLVFRRIPNYSNYEVSSCGTVIRRVWRKHTRTLKPQKCRLGYLRVCLNNDNGKRQNIGLHRLVAFAHIPNPKGRNEVNHIDANKENNSIENLEWVTRRQNIDHAKRLKLYKGSTGREVNTSRDRLIREMRKSGLSCEVIASKFNVTAVRIRQIVK